MGRHKKKKELATMHELRKEKNVVEVFEK